MADRPVRSAGVVTKTDLARRTRHIVDQVRRGRPIIVESYGEEQVAILDAVDYRCLRAVAAYRALPPRRAPATDSSATPRGLDEAALSRAVARSAGNMQVGWNLVLAACLDGDINMGRAAELLGINQFELSERLGRIGLVSGGTPFTRAEAAREVAALRR